MNKWDRYQMPRDLTGLTFLDIGCWEGDNCVEAVTRNASHVVGIDLCPSESLKRNLNAYPFQYMQMDVFSEKFIQMGRFDIVLCSGVLYHVENVFSLLFRLRSKVNKLLILETAITTKHGEDAILHLAAPDDPSGDPTVWWRPNRLCLHNMLTIAGFGTPRDVYSKMTSKPEIARLCVQAEPVERVEYARFNPRREQFMTIEGGERK